MKVIMKVMFIISAFAFTILIIIATLVLVIVHKPSVEQESQESLIGRQFRSDHIGWEVHVQNPDGIGIERLNFGATCSVKFGATITVIAERGDKVLVRQDPLPIYSSGYYSGSCPNETLFFLPRDEFLNELKKQEKKDVEAEKVRVETERAKEEVRGLLKNPH